MTDQEYATWNDGYDNGYQQCLEDVQSIISVAQEAAQNLGTEAGELVTEVFKIVSATLETIRNATHDNT